MRSSLWPLGVAIAGTAVCSLVFWSQALRYRRRERRAGREPARRRRPTWHWPFW